MLHLGLYKGPLLTQTTILYLVMIEGSYKGIKFREPVSPSPSPSPPVRERVVASGNRDCWR